jgi:Alpha-glucosidases, family 31 of glycosyl hydrolases
MTSSGLQREQQIVEPYLRWSSHDKHVNGSLEFLTHDIIRLSFHTTTAPEHTSWSVDPNAEPLTAPEVTVTQNEATTILQTSTFTVTASSTAEAPILSIARTNGTPILTTGSAYGITQEDNQQLSWTTQLQPGEAVYGGGLRTGQANKRGRNLLCWNTDPLPNHNEQTDPLYQCIPFLTSLVNGKAHGFFVDSAYRVKLDIGATVSEQCKVTTDDPHLVLYIFAGPTFADVLRQYTQITGRMPLPPRWSLGYQQSRWSYMSSTKVREIAASMQHYDIPCDAIYLDIDYMRGYRDFTFDPERFADAKKMLTELADQGIRVVTIIDPGLKVDPEFKPYQEGLAKGYYIRKAKSSEPYEGWVWPGLSVWPDFTRAEVRQWWAEQHQGLFEQGVSGIWDDMNEPTETRYVNTPSDVEVEYGKTLPSDAETGTPEAPLKHNAWHNAYGMLMARSSREAQEQLTPERRPFVLTRAATAGAQRYTAVWNGDTTSCWEHLRLMVSSNPGVGLSGMPFTGADIGGFLGNTNAELLVRETQAGAFMPFYRNHNASREVDQEPWVFGEPYTSHIRAAIKLRYRLLPYIYTLFHEAHETGAPLVRPLSWLAPNDPVCVRCDDQFLLGNDLLVAPVLEPGAQERLILLPPGQWFEFATGQLYGQPGSSSHITIPVTLSSIPLFVRAGAILPLAEPVNNTSATYTEPLTLRAYLTREVTQAQTELYDDDDHPQSEARGSFTRYALAAAWQADRVSVSVEQVAGQLALRYPGIQIEVVLPSALKAEPDVTQTTEQPYKQLATFKVQ